MAKIPFKGWRSACTSLRRDLGFPLPLFEAPAWRFCDDNEKIMLPENSDLLGHIDWDRPEATNERVVMRAPREHRARVLRNQFVRIIDAKAAGLGYADLCVKILQHARLDVRSSA